MEVLCRALEVIHVIRSTCKYVVVVLVLYSAIARSGSYSDTWVGGRSDARVGTRSERVTCVQYWGKLHVICRYKNKSQRRCTLGWRNITPCEDQRMTTWGQDTRGMWRKRDNVIGLASCKHHWGKHHQVAIGLRGQGQNANNASKAFRHF